jgi:hypothetical protein
MAVLGAVSVTASACGSSLIGSATSTPPSSSPSVSSQQRSALAKDGPLNSEVAVAFPVAACATSSDHPLESDGWLPTILLAPIPTGLVGKVEFYSDGFHTVLGPTGWICQQTVDIEGTITGLTVYPPGTADPPVSTIPTAGSTGIFAIYDTTGTTQGIALVCPFFAVPKWQQSEAHCSGIPPNGQQTSLATPDVVSVTDPAGVAGSLEGSGGFHPVTGTVIFPQSKAVTYGSSVDIALESCSLTDSSLCPTILSDFDVREFPVPAANGYSYGSR